MAGLTYNSARASQSAISSRAAEKTPPHTNVILAGYIIGQPSLIQAQERLRAFADQLEKSPLVALVEIRRDMEAKPVEGAALAVPSPGGDNRPWPLADWPPTGSHWFFQLYCVLADDEDAPAEGSP